MFKVDNKDNRPPFDNVLLVYYLVLVLLLSTLNMNTYYVGNHVRKPDMH